MIGSSHGRPVLGPASSLRALALSLVITAALAAGCGPGRRLDTTFESPAALAQAVVDGLNRKDPALLERLAVTEDEFRELVWPRQPAARPGRNIPWEYAWRSLAAKSRHQLRGRLAEWTGGARPTVVGVAFVGDTTDYGSYRVHRRSVLTLREPSGRLTTTRLFGSVIERRGRYKVFSYVVD